MGVHLPRVPPDAPLQACVLHQIGAVVASDQLGAVKVCLSCEGDLRGELVWCKACERKMEALYSQLERS